MKDINKRFLYVMSMRNRLKKKSRALSNHIYIYIYRLLSVSSIFSMLYFMWLIRIIALNIYSIDKDTFDFWFTALCDEQSRRLFIGGKIGRPTKCVTMQICKNFWPWFITNVFYFVGVKHVRTLCDGALYATW